MEKFSAKHSRTSSRVSESVRTNCSDEIVIFFSQHGKYYFHHFIFGDIPEYDKYSLCNWCSEALDPTELFLGDRSWEKLFGLLRVLTVVQQGSASDRHQNFVTQLAAQIS